ncbi:MAG: undecaprenyl-diphosphate phosphatase [Elusimicrobia bacterium]|nr:undecaprenyl-diphosphate phosphatase [Elusimicrobiota bacterium]
MSEIFKGIFVGVVQGITEFLPVSSSGHLVIARSILGKTSSGFEEIAFLHLATLFAVFFYFRRELLELIDGFFAKSGVSARKTVLYLFIASIPAGIVGFAFKDFIEGAFSGGRTRLVSLFFAVNSVILIASDYIKAKGKKLNAFNSFFIGVFQAVSVLPGISRSGSTITAGVFSGLERSFAVRFSFFMSIPAIFFGNILFNSFTNNVFSIPSIAGFLAAFFSGIFSIAVLMKVVQKARLRYFGFYTLLVAIVNLLI